MIKYLTRTKEVNDEEKKTIEELKKVDLLIKRYEKEHVLLMKSCGEAVEEEEENEDMLVYMYEQGKKEIQEVKESLTYLRSRWMNELVAL